MSAKDELGLGGFISCLILCIFVLVIFILGKNQYDELKTDNLYLKDCYAEMSVEVENLKERNKELEKDVIEADRKAEIIVNNVLGGVW